MPPPVFRFAPSPNGYLHLGHAYSALLNFDLARKAGGRFLLRIEDIDATRCRPEFEAAIYRRPRLARHCMGDPGAAAVGASGGLSRGAREACRPRPGLSEFREPRRDCKAGGASGRRTAPWPRDPDGAPLYPGTAKLLSSEERERLLQSGAPYALRLDMAAACARGRRSHWTERGEGPDGETGAVAARPEAWGDVILARKETPTSYHLSVVIDDALQGVTEVVRGQDLFWSTSVHRLLQQLLGLPQPAYRHHRLILDGCGAKAVEVDRGHRLARTPRRGREPGRHPPPGRPALIAGRFAVGDAAKRKARFGVTPPARPWHGGHGQGQGNHGAKIALTAHHADAEKAAAEKTRFPSCRAASRASAPP